ncbi:hypothetical protein QBC32DRAFT_385117 [Pseudoneurospora amorphoporcata]|uniref:Uncharacterized protein n=1 Tax=Pseudoneurospora amorphoporcata TaxID=241081 RepID=A0AAN6SB76_9PEZI|nr:hypothetical protein QBC32DRAFT_385117 [Pseudoneurospora amorphoporcata]
MAPPSLPGQASIQQLPNEIKDRICHFVGFEDYRDCDHISRPDLDRSQNDGYIWSPYSLMPNTKRTNTEVYNDLRALSLVSKDLTASAQRALYRIVALPSPVSFFRLLRTLRLTPEVGSHIRCLIPVPPGQVDYDLDFLPGILQHPCWKPFIHLFTPIFSGGAMEILDPPNIDVLPPDTVRNRLMASWNTDWTALIKKYKPVNQSKSCSRPRLSTAARHARLTTQYRRAFCEFMSRRAGQFFARLLVEVLQAITKLCPQLRGFHLLFNSPVAPAPIHKMRCFPFGCHYVLVLISLPISLGQGTLFRCNPLLSTLTVDFRTLTHSGPDGGNDRDATPLHQDTTPRHPIPKPLQIPPEHRLPSSIKHLFFIGYPDFVFLAGQGNSLYVLGQ